MGFSCRATNPGRKWGGTNLSLLGLKGGAEAGDGGSLTALSKVGNEDEGEPVLPLGRREMQSKGAWVRSEAGLGGGEEGRWLRGEGERGGEGAGLWVEEGEERERTSMLPWLEVEAEKE